MNLFQAREISKTYGEKNLFSHISLSISQGQKVGLIARNGTGKTTLMRIISGQETVDEGQCSYKNDLKLAYLPQEPWFDPELSVSQALLSDDNEQTRTIRAYEEFLEESGGEHLSAEEKDATLQRLIERMDALQAWDYEQRLRQILGKLQIHDLKAGIDTLSGGQLKRLALAKILMEPAELLLLDEPTNHLDVEMIEWLEQYLSRQKTSLLLVTHDRYFLDAVCNEIIEMEAGGLQAYRGNYAHYLEKKQEKMEADQARSEKAANLLRKETEWMRRSPPARTTKSKARIQSYHQLEKEAEGNQESQAGAIRIDMKRMGKKILELDNISKSFDQLQVIDAFSHVFKRGERLGIVGPNGTGKTTLLRIISGELTPDKGKVTTGETIHLGHYRQTGLEASDQQKVIDVITSIAERIPMGKDHWMNAPQFLQYFNFPYAMHNNQVGTLSGGEKRRLYLLTILMKNPNFLILDEPTNDLDIHTLNLLEDFLTHYPGCLIVVSHDRYFLDRLVDQLFVFRAPGDIKGYVGNYTEYRQMARLEAQKLKENQNPSATTAKAPSKSKEKTKLTYKEEKEFETLETEIEKLEKKKAVLLEKMNGGNLSPQDLMQAGEQFHQMEKSLEEKSNRWLELSQWI